MSSSTPEHESVERTCPCPEEVTTVAGVSSVPAHWLLDQAGKIIARADDPDELEAILAKRK